LSPKLIEESKVITNNLVMPNQTNPYGHVFGGIVVSWIDLAAAMVAEKHSASQVATVHIGEVSFKAPMKVGEHVKLEAVLQSVGKTSMKIEVQVYSENPQTGVSKLTTEANCTFVAIDKQGNPVTVPGIKSK